MQKCFRQRTLKVKMENVERGKSVHVTEINRMGKNDEKDAKTRMQIG